MPNYRQDDVDGGRGSSLIEQSEARTDPREKWFAAGANDDMAFLMAMLALAEVRAQRNQPTVARLCPERRLSMIEKKHPVAGSRQAEKPETLERPVETFEEDLAASVHEKAKSRDKDERAVAKAVMDLDGSD